MLKYFYRIGIALSVLLNVVLGGYSNQTFSARNWGWKRSKKPNLVWLIDAIFDAITLASNAVLRVSGTSSRVDFTNHCMNSWLYWYKRKNLEYNSSS